MGELTDAAIEAAERRGTALFEQAPRAVSARFDAASGRVVLELSNGCAYAFPVRLVEDLRGAPNSTLEDLHLEGVGLNLHWPQLDVDVFVPDLVAGLFGRRAWMQTLASGAPSPSDRAHDSDLRRSAS